jgi:hypothetical protein
MARDTGTGPLDGDDVVWLDDDTAGRSRRDQDPVGSLRDTEGEAGDEDELADTYDLDEQEARDAGVRLDGGTADEPGLD